MQVKINGKSYAVPQLGFREMELMENIAETSIVSVFQKNQVFVLGVAFVAMVAKCDKLEATRLCEQHILGGGKLEDIYKAFTDAVNESGFFKKLLDTDEEKNSMKKSKQTAE